MSFSISFLVFIHNMFWKFSENTRRNVIGNTWHNRDTREGLHCYQLTLEKHDQEVEKQCWELLRSVYWLLMAFQLNMIAGHKREVTWQFCS